MSRRLHSERNRLNLLFGAFIILLLFLFVVMAVESSPEQRYVLLSFDVEPVDGTQSVMDVLDVVYRHNVSSTFFVTGEYADANPSIVKLMTGHEIGCHGYSHTAFPKLDRAEKVKEIKWCRAVLEELTGRDVVGFRAPYNLIDYETLSILSDLGFLYDASMIRSWGVVYPRLDGLSIGEIPVSSTLLIPMEDVSWIHYLGMERAYFYVMKHKQGEFESYLFHPHHIAEHKQEFEEFIKYLKGENVIFISHLELTEMEHEGV